jgi:hypothetical protein
MAVIAWSPNLYQWAKRGTIHSPQIRSWPPGPPPSEGLQMFCVGLSDYAKVPG